jgi:hypothetical protein
MKGKNMTKTTRISQALFSIGLLTAVVARTNQANAAMVECSSITWVDTAPDYGGSLLVGCSGTNYAAYVNNGSTCRNVSMDTLKIWKATAESALLSGKKLQVYYTSCGGAYRIDAISLRK